MSSLREIRRRIQSVKNTRQITRAMQLVSSSKMKRAQDAALSGRPYTLLLADLLDTIGTRLDVNELAKTHPFFQRRQVQKRGIVVVSTDKGLCGPLNANLFRKITDDVTGPAKYYAVGRKASQFLSRTGRDLEADFTISEKARFAELRPLLKTVLDAFSDRTVDTVEVAYPSYINVLNQQPVIQEVLPIRDPSDIVNHLKKQTREMPALKERGDAREMTFEPSAESILAELPALYAKILIHQMLLESRASEHCARMVAMKAATDNASSLIDDLTLEYNKARQAAITQEILEIAAAARN